MNHALAEITDTISARGGMKDATGVRCFDNPLLLTVPLYLTVPLLLLLVLRASCVLPPRCRVRYCCACLSLSPFGCQLSECFPLLPAAPLRRFDKAPAAGPASAASALTRDPLRR